MAKSLDVDTSFEICAGKKMYLPSKKHFKAQMLSNGTYNFSEVVSSSDSNKSWILGGQDSCHVNKFLKIAKNLALHT